MEKGLPDKRHGCRGMGKVHQDLDGSSLLKETPMIKKQMSVQCPGCTKANKPPPQQRPPPNLQGPADSEGQDAIVNDLSRSSLLTGSQLD